MLLRLLLCLMLLPTLAHAATFWDETFETTGAGNRFGLLDSSGPVQLSTSSAYAGSKSARYMFDSPQVGSCLYGSATFIDCGGFYDATVTSTDTLWRRFWVRVAPGFTVSIPSTKLTKAGTANWSEWLVIGYNQNNSETMFQLTMDPQSGSPLLWGGTLRHDGQWQCFEINQQLNTPGVANGTYQLYLDGTLVSNSSTVIWRPASDTTPFSYVRLYRQYGSGDMFFDNYAVGNTRIGCGAAPPPGDTTAPSAPSTPTLTVSGGGLISVSWTNGTDASGVTGTNILRCAGAACSPVAILTVINNGSTVSYADASVANGTTYGYKLSNFDAAGNQSSFSAVAYATTGASYRTLTIIDSFNRADSADLGASWDEGYDTFYGVHTNMTVLSNMLAVDTLNEGALETHNTAVANDQWAQVTFSSMTAPDANLKVPGVILRANAPGNFTGYSCRLFHETGSPRTEIQRWASMVAETAIASESASSWQTGDKMRCEAQGTTIRLYQIRGTTETLLLSATDATYASGRVGVINYISPFATRSDIAIDDFMAGEFSVSAPTPPAITGVTSGSRTSTTVTYTGTPTTIRVATGTVANPGSKIEPLSSFPSGVYTFPPEVLATMTDYVCFYARDILGEENTTGYTCGSVPYTYDTAEVVISNTFPSADLPNGTTSTVIGGTLDKTATCRYDTTDTTYALMQTTSAMGLAGLTSSGTVTGLVTGANTFYMRCNFTDVVGDEHPSTTSTVITVTVAASTADTTAPSTVTNLVATVLSNSQVELAWTVATDNVAVAGYNVYLSVGDGNTTYLLETQTASVTRTVVNLQQNAVHNFTVRARDSSQNLSAANSNVVTVTTQVLPDVTPPSTMTNLRAMGVYKNSVILGWDLGTDDRGPVTTSIEMCTGAACSDFSQITSKLTLQQLIVALSPSTTYSFRGIFSDASNNPSAAYSNVVTITTGSTGLPQPRLPVPYSRPRTLRTP
jgi:hypothetical protein